MSRSRYEVDPGLQKGTSVMPFILSTARLSAIANLSTIQSTWVVTVTPWQENHSPS